MLSRPLRPMTVDLTERKPHPKPSPSDNLGSAKPSLALATSRFLPNPPPPEEDESTRRKRLSWRARFEFYEWGFFTLNLGTGACSLLVSAIPFEFGGRHALGCFFFTLNIFFYIINILGVSCRAFFHPAAFRSSFVIPSQALYFPTCILGFATIFSASVDYGVPHVGAWLVDVLYVLYWIYVGAGVACAALLQWSMYDQSRLLNSITPAECLPVFPLMLSGTLGAVLANVIDTNRANTLIICSFVFQGCGYLIGSMKLTAWMARNVLLGHPHDLRVTPIFYMAVGPPGFTAFAFLSLSQRAAIIFPAHGTLPSLDHTLVGPALQVICIYFSLLLFGQCLWFLAATTVIWIKGLVTQERGWGLAWFATTFPLVGFFLTAAKLGELLPSQFLKVLEVVGCVFVVAMWWFNVAMLFLSVGYRRMLVPPTQSPR